MSFRSSAKLKHEKLSASASSKRIDKARDITIVIYFFAVWWGAWFYQKPRLCSTNATQ